MFYRPILRGPLSRDARNQIVRQIAVFTVLAMVSGFPAAAQVSVTTYHYDNYRTGWNSSESTLTVAAVQSSSFGALGEVALDDEVDTQPLVVSGVTITAGGSPGVYNVVYVATENDTIYAINTANGKVLLNPNFGPPVTGPLGCGGTVVDVGINSTPVIDLASNTLYVMIYTEGSTGPEYWLHALDLGSLTDKVPPQMVTASHMLNDGKIYNFNAKYQRQRPALLLANGNVYAGFGSFCDSAPAKSRGWLLGWQTGTLIPLTGNELTDMLTTSPDNFFLSSIWMSGYGLASDDSGDILFVTANSDPSGTTYDGVNNIQESVVEVSPDLTQVLDLFTPSDVAELDQGDLDFGSGGVMVLPDQLGSYPHLAVAAGKVGTMFFMDEDDLGGFSTLANNVLGAYSIGDCWCGESYYIDPVFGAAVVSSGGQTVTLWQVVSSSTPPSLMSAISSASLETAASGFFTSVSSNSNTNPIIWAVSRPTPNQTAIFLYAFAPDLSGTTLQQIFKGAAGTWVLRGNNSNLVPVVANGRVFVASYKELTILGLRKSGATRN
jgi:hypothetical protein